jgi:transposase
MLASKSITYQDFLEDSKEPLQIRLAMVKLYQETHNISWVAKEFQTTRKTVRKWINRFTGAVSSLGNQSKAPKSPHRQIQERTEALLVQFKQEHASLGYDYIHHYLLEHGCQEIPSRTTCYNLWHKHGFGSKPKRKHETKKDLRAIKAKYKPFEKIQIDVKELKDIPNYLDQSLALGLARQKEVPLRYGLPMYQYTARDLKTGTLFVALAYGHNRHTAAIFADRVLTHLQRFGMVPRVIQTDNGTEFCNTRNALDVSPLFIQVVTRDGQTEHRRIPPGAKTWQSDVETSHWIIEKEFYNTIRANSDANMITKLRAYQWGFNVLRKNQYKGNRTPLEILQEEGNPTYATLPKEIMDFPTCILDQKFDAFIRGGYHVGLPTNRASASALSLCYNAQINHFKDTAT